MIRSGIIRARDRRGPTGRKLVAMIISHQAPAFISNWLSNASSVSFIAWMSMKYVVFFRGLDYFSVCFHNISLALLLLLGRKKTCVIRASVFSSLMLFKGKGSQKNLKRKKAYTM